MLSCFSSRQRPLRQVPKPVLVLLAAALMIQIYAHSRLPENSAKAETLPSAPGSEILRVASFGDPVALSKYLNLWLQIFDNQPGISIPFKDLDYTRVRGWLQASLDLDPRGNYPLLAAARLYGEIPYPEKQRLMLDFVHEKFLEAPDRRWSWLAHATVVAKHRMQDLPLALKYAQALADKATGSQVPHWAKQMAFSVLEDMGELQAAEVLIGGLLDSGQITDPHEFRFLSERLQKLREAGGSARN